MTTQEQATAPIYPFSAPGVEVLIFTGEMVIGDVRGTGRVWMQMTGDVDIRWELEPGAHHRVRLGEARLVFTHPKLGAVDAPVRVTSSTGCGIVLATAAGRASSLDEIVAHWVNVPSIYPAEGLESAFGTWAGRWTGSGGGWSIVLDGRHDHRAVTEEAKATPFHVVTHASVLRRTNGQSFSPEEARDGLYSWQVALSFALGRWVAPALAVGFSDGSRVWELWSPWRCDNFRGSVAWWDFHKGDDLGFREAVPGCLGRPRPVRPRPPCRAPCDRVQ